MTQTQPASAGSAKALPATGGPSSLSPSTAADPGKNRRGLKFKLALVVLTFAAATGIYFAHFSDNRPIVSVERVAPAPTDRVLIVSGRTRSELEADLRTAVSGTVATAVAREGARIKADQVLIELDAEPAQLNVREAQAALDSAVVSRQRAQEDFDRARALGTAISQVERTRAAEALAAAKLEVQRLSAALERAKIALSDYRIVAPFSGTLLDRLVEPGEFTQAGSVVLRIADLSHLYAEIEVDEDYSASLQAGQKALIRLAGRDDTLPGRVSLIEPEVNTTTGAVPVRIAFDQIPIAPTGLTAIVNVVTASSEAALTVPRTALVARAGPAVFKLRDGKAVLTPIKIVDWPADRVEVKEGLRAGDLIILNPEKITDGEAVKTTSQSAGKGP
ncbi:MAG: efflux RND transporter periplasmic adaptor subunit [Gammaproteobacteria bacterium]|nr:MAG: efflux RND transporter periplasmic adaptor subunit [Gammaproteobacteria bacterium]